MKIRFYFSNSRGETQLGVLGFGFAVAFVCWLVFYIFGCLQDTKADRREKYYRHKVENNKPGLYKPKSSGDYTVKY